MEQQQNEKTEKVVSDKVKRQIEKAYKNPAGVKVGQVWHDNDPRINNGRRRVVIEIDLPYAVCTTHKETTKVRIRLDRFASKGTRGYTLIQDV